MRKLATTLALTLLAVATAVALLPFAVALVSGGLATALGCRLDEGSPHPCLLRGDDIGGSLYTAAVLGTWLSLPALPVLLVAGVLWVVVAVLARRSSARRSRVADPAQPRRRPG